jgi:hypothetical protein
VPLSVQFVQLFVLLWPKRVLLGLLLSGVAVVRLTQPSTWLSNRLVDSFGFSFDQVNHLDVSRFALFVRLRPDHLVSHLVNASELSQERGGFNVVIVSSAIEQAIGVSFCGFHFNASIAMSEIARLS